MRVIASVCHAFCDPAKRGCRGKETKTMAIRSRLETPNGKRRQPRSQRDGRP